MHDLDQLLELAKNAALAAGERLTLAAQQSLQVNYQGGKDIKLQADVDSEKLIRSILEPMGLPIIGEELGGDESLPQSNQLYWVIDPLDGTYNFFRNCPHYCVIIGLMRGVEPVLGVVNEFSNKNLYYARADGQLHCNGEIIIPEWADKVSNACLATGFPAHFDYSDGSLARFFDLIRAYSKTRMTGCAGMASVFVATGKMDAYYEERVRLWDIAGGLALIKAAGGHIRVTMNDAAPFACNMWMAGKEEFILG